MAGAAGYLLGDAAGATATDSGSERTEAQRNAAARAAADTARRSEQRGYYAGLSQGRRDGRARGEAVGKGAGTTAATTERAAETVTRSCGDLAQDGAGTYGVASVNVECTTARQVAQQWETECASQPSGDCTVSTGFACNYEQTGEELGSITCSNADRKVTFENGA
jgi:hypothetical protein